MRNAITGHVSHTVILDHGSYGGSLTVTATGTIDITDTGGNGVYLNAASGQGNLLNQGTIIAGVGAFGHTQGGAGGVGVAFGTFGTISNAGTIQGGAGGDTSGSGSVGSGGTGILLAAGGVVHNTGVIDGGEAGRIGKMHDIQPGLGGVGVDLVAGGTLTNSGYIQGGYGGLPSLGAAGVYANGGTLLNTGRIAGAYSGGQYGMGGAGVTLIAGEAINRGIISGGGGGYIAGPGGAGVNLLADSTLLNGGTIGGGGPDSSGVYLAGGSKLTNSGTIISLSGAAVDITGDSTVRNSGVIIDRVGFVVHGSGADVASGSLLNTGEMTGVVLVSSMGSVKDAGMVLGSSGSIAGYYYHDYYNATAGGSGVALTGGRLSMSNTGSVIGGVGGTAYQSSPSANGGVAVSLSDGGQAVVAGFVQGGQGGLSYNKSTTGGTGGVGVSVSGGAQAVVSGLTEGGQGGLGYYTKGGTGGAGAYINGGTLTTSGTITGGAGGMGATGTGQAGVAVQFGTLAGTLVVDPGATFNGAILANAAASDTLELAGKVLGTLSGFGTMVTGFTTIAEDSHANWLLAGSVGGTGAIDIGASAALTLSGAVSIAQIAFSPGGHDLVSLGTPGEVTSIFAGFGAGDAIDLEGLKANTLSYGAGTLTLFENQVQIDVLAFSGAQAAEFGLASDGHGGTEITYRSNPYGEASAASYLAPEHNGLAVAGRIISDITGHERAW